jgi:hypothetical protein
MLELQGRTMESGPLSDARGGTHGLARRDFLKVGAGFSLALTFAGALGTLGGCGEAAKAPAKGFAFLQPGDVEMFSALAPAIVVDLAQLDAGQRAARVGDVLHNVDGTCAALDLHSRQELRKLLDLLAIAPLRYVLTGVGAWNEAGIDTLQAFLARWRGSRFATLNAGGNILVKLVCASYYVLPASWAATGYPGPLAAMYKAVNS